MRSIQIIIFGGVILLLQAAAPRTAATQQADSTSVVAAEALPEPAFSGRGAFVRSLVLPGWGQAYVGAPGRGAVYFAMASGSYYMTWVARRQLLDARREQQWQRDQGQIEATAQTEFVLARERHFEDWAALSLFTVFLAGADAYVSAYLADFDERIGVQTTPSGALRIQAVLPLQPR